MATANRFGNYSNDQLADMIGEADSHSKHWADHLAELKNEFKRRNCELARGEHFMVTVDEQSSTRLDTKGLRGLLGDALAPYEVVSMSRVMRIKPVAQVEV